MRRIRCGFGRGQSEGRCEIELDSQFLMAKINPLADWTENMVWVHIRMHQLAYNPM